MILWCPLKDRNNTQKMTWLMGLAIFILQLEPFTSIKINKSFKSLWLGLQQKTKHFYELFFRIFRKPVQCSQMAHLLVVPGLACSNKCANVHFTWSLRISYFGHRCIFHKQKQCWETQKWPCWSIWKVVPPLNWWKESFKINLVQVLILTWRQAFLYRGLLNLMLIVLSVIYIILVWVNSSRGIWKKTSNLLRRTTFCYLFKIVVVLFM